VVDAGIVVGWEVFMAFIMTILVHLLVVDLASVASENPVFRLGILAGNEDNIVTRDRIDVL